MGWDVGVRRVTPGVFVLALVTLLLAPVGNPARASHHQTSAGPTQSKAATSAIRWHHMASHVDASDRLELDPATAPDQNDATEPGRAIRTEPALASATARPDRGAAARGPPAR